MKMNRSTLSEIMFSAWSFVRQYGFTIAEGMKQAWALFKLRNAMSKGIVKFMYMKLNGDIRTAWGTLSEDILGSLEPSEGNRRANTTVQVYYDTEKAAWRSFKKANFLRIA